MLIFPVLGNLTHISLQAWQKATCDLAMQCAPRGRRHQPHIFSCARFIWNIYPLEKVTGGKVAAKLISDERLGRIFSQLNSIVLIITKSQYFQLILYHMLILLGNGIIQQPISYYHEIYALLSQKVFCPQSMIPFLQPLVVDARKHWQGLQPGISWGWDKLLVLVQWPSDWDQSPCIVLAHACRIASRSRWNQSTMNRCSNIWVRFWDLGYAFKFFYPCQGDQ